MEKKKENAFELSMEFLDSVRRKAGNVKASVVTGDIVEVTDEETDEDEQE